MNPITGFQLASWTIGLWDYWLVGIEAGAGPTICPGRADLAGPI